MRLLKLAPLLAAMVVLSLASGRNIQASADTTTAPFVTSLDQAKQLAVDKNQHVLLDFYTTW